jgi:Flp pilus assembly pilin Flp
MTLVRALWSEKGQATVEYATLAVLISIAAISVMAALGVQVQGLFQDVVDALP